MYKNHGYTNKLFDRTVPYTHRHSFDKRKKSIDMCILMSAWVGTVMLTWTYGIDMAIVDHVDKNTNGYSFKYGENISSILEIESTSTDLFIIVSPETFSRISKVVFWSRIDSRLEYALLWATNPWDESEKLFFFIFLCIIKGTKEIIF